MSRYLGILSALFPTLFLMTFALAQAPGEPPKVYTGNLGGGLALTGGNTHTKNFNLTAGLVRDPKTKNVIKGAAAFLSGDQNDFLILNRTSFNVRDEYTVSGRTFVFGQLDYLRDQFKQIVFLWVPAAGVGYKLINTDSTQFILDTAVGGLVEKNPGLESSKSGSLVPGQRFQRKLSPTATFTESLSTIFKTKDFNDSLTNFSVGVTTRVAGNLELKVEFIDSYKNKPANLQLKKNDTAFVTAFIVKY